MTFGNNLHAIRENGRGHVSIFPVTLAERLSEHAVRAAFELVAEAMRQGSRLLVVNLAAKNVGTRSGSCQISD